jgi:hypothetical protein
MSKPIARFRVYVAYGRNGQSSLYFMVYVWATKKEMLDNRPRLGLSRSSCDAHTFSYDEYADKTRKRKNPIVGEIHFHKRKVSADAGIEAVTHETFHAVASLFRRLRMDFSKLTYEGMSRPKTDNEEVIAEVQGKMARAIMTKFHKLGLFPWQNN